MPPFFVLPCSADVGGRPPLRDPPATHTSHRAAQRHITPRRHSGAPWPAPSRSHLFSGTARLFGSFYVLFPSGVARARASVSCCVVCRRASASSPATSEPLWNSWGSCPARRTETKARLAAPNALWVVQNATAPYRRRIRASRLCWDWAHPAHICIASRHPPAMSATGLCSHCARNWARRCHMCAGTAPYSEVC